MLGFGNKEFFPYPCLSVSSVVDSCLSSKKMSYLHFCK